MMCSVDECEKPRKAKGMCQTHYMRALRGVPLDAPVRRYNYGGDTCSMDGCEKQAHSQGWCPMHYQRWRSNGDPAVVQHTSDGTTNTYGAAHHRLYARRGPATAHDCVDCDQPAQEWCYDGGCEEEMVGVSNGFDVPFCNHPDHYTPRCASCHRQEDRTRSAKLANPDRS